MTAQNYYNTKIENLDIVEIIEKETGIKIPLRGDPTLINCPLPGHSDKHPSFAIYRRTNSWWCFGCNRGSRPIDFLIHFHGFTFKEALTYLKMHYGIQLDKPMRVKSSSKKEDPGVYHPLYPFPDDLREYLHSRKLNDETIARFKLTVFKNELTGERAIGIPLFNERGEVINWKLRIEPSKENESENKYWFLFQGKKIGVFPLPLIDFDKEEICICEGEFDTILLHQEGYNAITSTTGGNSIAKNEELVNIVKKFKKVYLLPDNDETGARWAFELKERLRKLPIEIVEIRLPDGIKDVTELYQNGRTLQDIKKGAIVFKSFLTLDEILSYQESENEEDDIDFFGHKGIILKGSTCLISGYPKIGKTELTSRFALELRKKGLKVYYLSEEDIKTLKRRFSKISSDDHYNLESKGFLKVCPLAYFGVKGIKDLLEFETFDVLIVDTLRSSIGTDLKDEKEAQEIVKNVLPIIEIAKRKEITLVFVHHQTKTTDMSIRSVAGSHALAGIVDVILNIFPVDENSGRQRKIEIVGRVIEPQTLFYEIDENNKIKFVNVVKRDELTNLLIEMKPKFVDRHYKTEEIEQYVNKEANRRGIKFTKRELREKLHKLYEQGEYDRNPKERSKGARYMWKSIIKELEKEPKNLESKTEELSTLDIPY
jgi:5S rRNA maturation endonuclease (ribonuclease M5)/archaellum biogenesis ATPase FlaH